MADDHINHNLINKCYEKFNDGYEVVCPSRFIKDGKKSNSYMGIKKPVKN